MKVSTELKRVINRSFDEKKELIEKEAKSEINKEYENIVSKFRESKEFKAYVKTAKELQKLLNELSDIYSRDKVYTDESPLLYVLNSQLKLNPEDFFNLNSGYTFRNKEYVTRYGSKINELEMERESLLIKLTYEKDFDKIKELLAEYGINI